jgi:hypothetical protein
MFLHITNAILVLFTVVSIYVTHKNSSHFRDGYVNFRTSRMNDTTNFQDNFFRYNIGTFDLEMWACELEDVTGAAVVRNESGRQCRVETAGSAVMIPFIIIAWLVAGVGIWGFVGGGWRGPDGERIKTEEVGLDMGNMNATDEQLCFCCDFLITSGNTKVALYPALLAFSGNSLFSLPESHCACIRIAMIPKRSLLPLSHIH